MVTWPCNIVSINGSPKRIAPGNEIVLDTPKNPQIKKYGQENMSRRGTDIAQFMKAILL
jgi:hypothetical protein